MSPAIAAAAAKFDGDERDGQDGRSRDRDGHMADGGEHRAMAARQEDQCETIVLAAADRVAQAVTAMARAPRTESVSP